jgi:hypothetical protein
MHVLVTEASFSESTQVAEALRGARRYVRTCHEGAGVCQALRPGRYPLDLERPVDLVVDGRGQQPELTAPIYLTADGHRSGQAVTRPTSRSAPCASSSRTRPG